MEGSSGACVQSSNCSSPGAEQVSAWSDLDWALYHSLGPHESMTGHIPSQVDPGTSGSGGGASLPFETVNFFPRDRTGESDPDKCILASSGLGIQCCWLDSLANEGTSLHLK